MTAIKLFFFFFRINQYDRSCGAIANARDVEIRCLFFDIQCTGGASLSTATGISDCPQTELPPVDQSPIQYHESYICPFKPLFNLCNQSIHSPSDNPDPSTAQTIGGNDPYGPAPAAQEVGSSSRKVFMIKSRI
jgi:hypothetical protein